MSRYSKNAVIVLAVAIVFIFSGQGCSKLVSKASSTTFYVTTPASWSADLDDYRKIRLSCIHVKQTSPASSNKNEIHLNLKVTPREHLKLERNLKMTDIKKGEDPDDYIYENVEIRTDDEHKKVWFVDKEIHKVIASLDVDTGLTTGPDDLPPAWATPDGGIILISKK